MLFYIPIKSGDRFWRTFHLIKTETYQSEEVFHDRSRLSDACYLQESALLSIPRLPGIRQFVLQLLDLNFFQLALVGQLTSLSLIHVVYVERTTLYRSKVGYNVRFMTQNMTYSFGRRLSACYILKLFVQWTKLFFKRGEMISCFFRWHWYFDIFLDPSLENGDLLMLTIVNRRARTYKMKITNC